LSGPDSPASRIYLSVLALFLCVYYVYKLQLGFKETPGFESIGMVFLLCSGLILEYLIALLQIKACSGLRYFSLLGYLVLIAYTVINVLQIVSFEISADFVTRLALGNVEFVHLMVTRENLFIVA